MTAEESLEMARLAAQDGTDTIIATPHYRDMQLEAQLPRAVRELTDTLNAALRSNSSGRVTPGIRIFVGMSYRLDPYLPDLVDSENVTTLNRTRFLLVEPPFNRCPPYVEEVIGRLITQRLVPVLAHPERNVEFQRRPKRLQRLVDEGVVVQLAAGSLTGQYGVGAKRAADQFVRRGMAHVVGSEMHAVGLPRPPLLSEAFEIVEDLVGEQEAINLFETNPEMLLEGRTPHVERVVERRSPRARVKMPAIGIKGRMSERTRRRWQRRFRPFRRIRLFRRTRRRTNRA